MRDLPVGNGNLLVNFDRFYQIRDVYFPHVGQENHTDGFPFRLGIWVDEQFSWVNADVWERQLKYLPDTLVTNVTLVNQALGIEIDCHDTVASGENIFVRSMAFRDLNKTDRNVRVFFHQDFRIYENKVGDTAYYDPETFSLIHYQKHRYFLVNTAPHFDEFATGRKAFRESEGTWRDAEDGELHGGAITEGSVDSTVRVNFELPANSSYELFYWIAAGTTHGEVESLNRHILDRHPKTYLKETETGWKEWLNTRDPDLGDLSPEIYELYKRSLLIIRTQIDNGGAIIAANDHDVIERATDHYSYLWPRDGAFVANAMDKAGMPEISRRFFELCGRIVHERGYFLQKYSPDGTTGSGWHASWDTHRKQPLVPIQEDETALVIWAMWEHFDMYRDVEYFRPLYRDLIVRCADFMAGYRDSTTNLPLASWNLWEDRRGVHTFTCSTIVAGLRAGANFARLFNEVERAESCDIAAEEVVAATTRYLYSPEHNRFLRGLLANGDDPLYPDPIVDASIFGIFYFGCLAPDDEMVVNSMAAIDEHLSNQTVVGGVARFENDGYMLESSGIVGNTWIICTLWLAEYYIAKARSAEDLDKPLELINWVVQMALPSGVLAEQIDPVTGKPLSVSPLTWSHSTFVSTVINYQKKRLELSAFATQG